MGRHSAVPKGWESIEEYEKVLRIMNDYIWGLAHKYAKLSPYGAEDYAQEAKLRIWSVGDATKDSRYNDGYYKKVVRTAIDNFHVVNVKKVKRAEMAYQEDVARRTRIEEDF